MPELEIIQKLTRMMQVIYEGNKYGVKIAGELAEEFLVCDRLD